MRLGLFAAGILALTACGSTTSFKLQGTSCSAGFTSWTGGLTYDILQNQAGDGTFDFDPPGQVEARIAGKYDLSTGDFDYTVSYDPAYYLTSTTVTGFGYAKQNGDLDLTATDATTDVNGVATTTNWRWQRTGCDETIRYADGQGNTETTTRTYAPGQADFTNDIPIAGDNDEQIAGTAKADLTYADSLSWQSQDGVTTDDFNETGDVGAGTSHQEWEQVQPGSYGAVTYDGTTDVDITGTTVTTYTDSNGGTTSTTVDYSGNGGGTYDNGNNHCQLTYESFSCTYTCGGGVSGSC